MTIVEQGGGPAPQAAPDLIKETTTQTFVKDVIEESKRQPVLIDFWAPWCGPCRQLTPILEKAVRAAKGKVKLVKMNIDEHPAIPGQMGIQSIPAVIAFVNGQPADGFMGAVPESQVNAFIDKLTKGMPAAGEPNIAEILARGRSRAGRRRCRHRRADLCRSAGGRCHQHRGACGPREMLRRRRARSSRPSRRWRWCRNPSATTPRSRPCRRRSILPSRPRRRPGDRAGTESRRKPARSSGAIRSGDRAQRQRQARRGDRATARKSSSATANGTRTARASSWCSSSRPGAATDEATVEGRKRLSTILFS